MSRQAIITSKGLNLLHSSSGRGEASYWIGYYGLAYVPSEKRGVGQQDELKPSMTELTKTGDHIYNVWQGAMPRNGYAEESAAGQLFGLSMYTSNLTDRFRYVLDSDGNNNLVMWKGTSDSSNSEVSGAHIYRGVGSGADVECLPVPAPLFYMGEPNAYAAPMSKSEFVNHVMSPNVSLDYPIVNDVPAVTPDPRVYTASASTMVKPPSTFEGEFTDVSGIEKGGKYEWTASQKTYTQGGDGGEQQEITDEHNIFCNQFWKFQSISNYNRFHAPATAEGFLVDFEPACRNMSKATRLFPINYYKVLNVKENMASPVNELASGLQFTMKINTEDMFNTTALRALTITDEPTSSGVTSIDGTDMYQTKKSSFKFNRVGLYAVRMKVHRYLNENNLGATDVDEYNVQFEIQGDEEPVLFAVIDLDQTVTLVEGGSTPNWEFNVNININEADDDSQLIRDAGVFYNMYEDDAINWYANQLIANASISESVTDLGIQMNYLRTLITGGKGDGACGGMIDFSDIYALKNHTHDYIKNIVDSVKDGNFAVRGIDTIVEGSNIGSGTYDYVPEIEGQTAYGYISNDENDKSRTYFVVDDVKI